MTLRTSTLEVARRADDFFMKRSPIHQALRRIAEALQELQIPFAVAGAMACNAHGHTRTTADIDILLTRDGLAKFRERWLGRGWVEKFEGSKNLRDAVARVNVDVLLSGDYPGDGKEKPVRFPSPSAEVAELDEEGIPVLKLAPLLELKLASGMTAPHRPQDLADVIALIRVRDLPRDFATQLHPYVQEKFDELWQASQYEEE